MSEKNQHQGSPWARGVEGAQRPTLPRAHITEVRSNTDFSASTQHASSVGSDVNREIGDGREGLTVCMPVYGCYCHMRAHSPLASGEIWKLPTAQQTTTMLAHARGRRVQCKEIPFAR